MTPGIEVETYEGRTFTIATMPEEGIINKHVDVFRVEEGNQRYSCVVRGGYDGDSNFWTETNGEFSGLLYDQALKRGKELAQRKSLPLLLEGGDHHTCRTLVWHPKKWIPMFG